MRTLTQHAYRAQEEQNQLYPNRMPYRGTNRPNRAENERPHQGRPACDVRIRYARQHPRRSETQQAP